MSLRSCCHSGRGQPKVIACCNGHGHSDRHQVLDGTHYVTVNSMSYRWRWLGRRREHDVYDAGITAAHPAMRRAGARRRTTSTAS